MKIVKLSLVAAMTAGLCSVASANNLSEALKAGKVSGEVTATYEQRKIDNTPDAAYSVGSFALKYETGVWNNLSLTSKFRAYANLFEEESNDATHTFKEKNGENRDVDVEELFLTYTPSENVTVKVGRQAISSIWVNKTHDAVKVDAKFGNTSLEAIYTKRTGRVYSRDYRPMESVGEKGVYQLALTQKFNDMLSATIYDRIAPDVNDIYGIKLDGKIGPVSLGAHYAKNSDDKNSADDSNLLHLTAKTTIAGFTPYIGYFKVDDKADFPGWTTSGETFAPFEEGDHMYKQGSKHYYAGVSKSFGKLSANLLHGIAKYGTTQKFEQTETTLWLGYPVTKDLKANLGYTITNEDDKDAGTNDLNQLNMTLTYSF